MDDAEVYLHDPAGLPHVSLPLDGLVAAWRADLVGYKRGPYRWWTTPRRVASPTEDQLFANAMLAFAEVYRSADTCDSDEITTGSAAIELLAARVREGELPGPLYGHLTAFALQVGARRALDFAEYFTPRRPDLAALKQEQARLFGSTHTLLVRQAWCAAADALTALAEVEQRIHDHLAPVAVQG
jgi:hypothetical protein